MKKMENNPNNLTVEEIAFYTVENQLLGPIEKVKLMHSLGGDALAATTEWFEPREVA